MVFSDTALVGFASGRVEYSTFGLASAFESASEANLTVVGRCSRPIPPVVSAVRLVGTTHDRALDSHLPLWAI